MFIYNSLILDSTVSHIWNECSTTYSFRKKFTILNLVAKMFEPLIWEYTSHSVVLQIWFILVQNLDENYKRFIIGRSWRKRIGWEEEEAYLQEVCIQRSWSGPAIGHVQVCFNEDMMWHKITSLIMLYVMFILWLCIKKI